MANLERRGLATEEAFLIASRRIGSSSQLGTEFGKVNVRSLWLNRILWMLIGIQAFAVIHSLASIANTGTFVLVARLFGSMLNSPAAAWCLALCAGLIRLLVIAALLVTGWRLMLHSARRHFSLDTSGDHAQVPPGDFVGNMSCHFIIAWISARV